MKWIPGDIETYKGAKEYIDTAVIPLIGIASGEGIGQSASITEFITLLTGQLERQFTGRMVLLPSFTYLQSETAAEKADRLTRWAEEMSAEGFKHIFLVTSDQEWRNQEGMLGGTLVWLPSLPLASFDDKQKAVLLNDQIKQLMSLFAAKWRESEAGEITQKK